MTCAACAARIEKVLNRVDGVHADVNFANESAHVEFDRAKATTDALIEAVRNAGYDATPAADPFTQPDDESKAEGERYRASFGCSSSPRLLTAPFIVQMLTMAFGGPHGIARRLQFALATPVQFWAGARFYSGAWKALRGGTANMDVLIALGTTAAFAYSVAVWLLALPGTRLLRGGSRRHHTRAPRQAARAPRPCPDGGCDPRSAPLAAGDRAARARWRDAGGADRRIAGGRSLRRARGRQHRRGWPRGERGVIGERGDANGREQSGRENPW
jgi:copper chaperone CopZ